MATPAETAQPAPARESLAARLVGALDLDAVPWNLVVTAALGVWMMTAPAVLGITDAAAANHHIGGALVVTGSVIAFGEILRPVRLLNLPIGLWFIGGTWLLSGGTDGSRWHDVMVGAAIVATSLRRGHVGRQFADWNRWLI
jgi:hypothetical protein